jgi:hypothetical protein
VLLSILIHGVTATPLMRWIDRVSGDQRPEERGQGDVVD